MQPFPAEQSVININDSRKELFMKKISVFLCLAAALAAMSACSSEDTTSQTSALVPEENFTPAHEPEPHFYLTINNSELITPETDSISVTAGCYGDISGTGSMAFRLEKQTKNGWVEVKRTAPDENPSAQVLISEDDPITVTLKMSDYEPLEMLGEYRIVTQISGEDHDVYFQVLAENPPLTKNDITMKIAESEITEKTRSLTLEYEYVGSAEYADYGFGCDYTLERLENGEWSPVPFSENAAFIDLGYLIGTYSTKQSTSVSLDPSFYSQPLTVGRYRVVKPIENITLTAEFEIK